MKVESEMEDNWSVRNKEFTISGIRLAIKGGLPKSMRGELDDHPEDYRSLAYEYWCDLLSTIKVKDESKRAAVHIKKIASAMASSLSDSDEYMRILKRKKANNSVMRSNKSPRRAHDIHHDVQRYCVLFKKSGTSEQKHLLRSSEDCTGVRTKCPIKDGMRGPMGSSTNSV